MTREKEACFPGLTFEEDKATPKYLFNLRKTTLKKSLKISLDSFADSFFFLLCVRSE